MPVALGFHAQVQTQAALNQLLQDVQAERKRAIVVEGAQGRIITVLKKGNVIAELLRSLTGQTRREAQRLEQFRASLPAGVDLQPQHAQVAQALVEAVQPPVLDAQAPGAATAVQAPVEVAPVQAAPVQAVPVQAASVEAAPVEAAAVGQYVEQQTHNQSCFKHALAAYYNRPVFPSFENFLEYRNKVYPTLGAFIEQDDFNSEGTAIVAVQAILETMRQDPQLDHSGIDTQAPWSINFTLDVKRHGKPRRDEQDAQELDVHIQAFAQESASNRFIVNTGSGASGHFWFLSRDPATEQWTMANSTGKTLKQGPSPSRLLEQDFIRGGQIYLWTQLKGDPEEVHQRFSQVTLTGEPPALQHRQPTVPNAVRGPSQPVAQSAAAQAQVPQQAQPRPQAQAMQPSGAGLGTIPEEDGSDDDDLPPPILPPGFRQQARQPEPPVRQPEPPVRGAQWVAANPGRPIEGVDLSFQREIEAHLESADVPGMANALAALNASLAQVRHNEPARYAALMQSIDDDLQRLSRSWQPEPELLNRIRTNLQNLDDCSRAWRGKDARLDADVMNYLRAANGQRHESQATEQDRAYRTAIAGLSKYVRRETAIWAGATRGQRPWPSDWTADRNRNAEEGFRSAQGLGIADVASMPVWNGSQEEQNHARYIREVDAYLQRWS